MNELLVALLAAFGTALGLCWLAFDVAAYRPLRRAAARGVLVSEPTSRVQTFHGRGLGRNPDIEYRYAAYALGPGQTLVLEGRVHPDAHYTSVAVYDPLLQSVPPLPGGGPTLLNHEQLELGPDGSFRIVMAPTRPSRGNWLDTSRAPRGVVFERHIGAVPEERTELRARM